MMNGAENPYLIDVGVDELHRFIRLWLMYIVILKINFLVFADSQNNINTFHGIRCKSDRYMAELIPEIMCVVSLCLSSKRDAYPL